MGTSQRFNPSVKGQPNWGKASSAISRLEKALADEDILEQNKDQVTPQQYDKRKVRITQRVYRNYRNAVSNTIKAGGGAKAVSSGSSKAFGRGGISVIQNFVHAIAEIKEQSLSSWLETHGHGSLEEKTKEQVIETITIYVQENLVAMDDTAANEALEYLMDLFNDRLGEDPTQYDAAIGSLLVTGEMKELLDCFFAKYIFCHLSQSIHEKLVKEKGENYANATMDAIKDLISEDVKGLPADTSILNLDWSSHEGENYCKEEFARIIHIYLDDEN